MREHGLARAGLARDGVQAGREPQFGPLDQQKVLDSQLEEHATRNNKGPGRSGRSDALP